MTDHDVTQTTKSHESVTSQTTMSHEPLHFWTSKTSQIVQKSSCRHYGARHNTNRDIKQTADVTN